MSSHDFKEIQDVFTQRVRSSEFSSLDGVEDRRLNIYRELFYNNIESFISGTFPVLKDCVSQAVCRPWLDVFLSSIYPRALIS